MSIVEKVVGSLFGSKSERDLKELQPWVDKINAETDRISGMSTKLTSCWARTAVAAINPECRPISFIRPMPLG